MTRSRKPTVVIGSGPAGIAAAVALVDRGIQPLVLDIGNELEAGQAAAVSRWGAADDPWQSDFLQSLRGSFEVDVDRLPLKPTYGSLFPYALGQDDDAGSGVAATPSVGRGGLSTVWGAAMLPYAADDLAGWPITVDDLAPHYREVLKFVPLAGEHDDLAEIYPLYGEPGQLPPTRQIEALLRDATRARGELRRRGFRAGRSRLALHTVDLDRRRACRRVGLCMYGCPYGSIYTTAQTLDELVRSGKVRYRSRVTLCTFVEQRQTVRLRIRDLATGVEEDVAAERVFVACGPLETTRLALTSLEAHEREVEFADSTYFTVPVLRHRAAGPVTPRTAGVTLAQVFLELDDSALCAGRIHLQLYGFNDLMLRAIAARLRLSERTAGRLLQPFLSRLLYLQGYLHSASSRRILGRLAPGALPQLELETVGPDPTPTVRQVLGRLGAARRLLRLEPVAPLLTVWPPGKGFHTGGSFPMRREPKELETDVLGRPSGCNRVHLVDASVFPAVPASTITLTVMANAHRIASSATEA